MLSRRLNCTHVHNITNVQYFKHTPHCMYFIQCMRHILNIYTTYYIHYTHLASHVIYIIYILHHIRHTLCDYLLYIYIKLYTPRISYFTRYVTIHYIILYYTTIGLQHILYKLYLHHIYTIFRTLERKSGPHAKHYFCVYLVRFSFQRDTIVIVHYNTYTTHYIRYIFCMRQTLQQLCGHMMSIGL